MTYLRRLVIPCFLIAALGVSTTGRAQVTTATMYGTVLDPSGAFIPSAQVTLTNEGTGAAP